MLQKQFEWQGYTWETGHAWGSYHPKMPWMWFDPECVSIDNGALCISNKRKWQIFKPEPKDWISIPFAAGVVRLVPDVHFGYFEIEAMLPSGHAQWPAFWMWGAGWPREIDVFEGYTLKSGSYLRPSWPRLWGFWHVESNIHRRDIANREIEVFGKAKRHWLGFSDPSKTWNRYGVNWQADRIEWTFNGRVIRVVTDPDVLKFFAEHKMTLILSNYMTITGSGKVRDMGGVFKVRRFQIS